MVTQPRKRKFDEKSRRKVDENSAQNTWTRQSSTIFCDATTGAELWNHPTYGAAGANPVVRDGVVYATSDNGRYLYVLDAASGDRRWAAKISETDNYDVDLTISQGTVYIGTPTGTVWAVDAASGASRWRSETWSSVFSGPSVAEDVAYVGTEDGKLHALDAASGELIWSYQTGSLIDSAPVVSDNLLYVAGYDGIVYALHTR